MANVFRQNGKGENEEELADQTWNVEPSSNVDVVLEAYWELWSVCGETDSNTSCTYCLSTANPAWGRASNMRGPM